MDAASAVTSGCAWVVKSDAKKGLKAFVKWVLKLLKIAKVQLVMYRGDAKLKSFDVAILIFALRVCVYMVFVFTDYGVLLVEAVVVAWKAV